MIRLEIQAYLCNKCCKQQCFKEVLFWCNLNPKDIIVFPCDGKQFILHLWEITFRNYNKLGKAIPNYNTFWEIIIPKHNTVWEK